MGEIADSIIDGILDRHLGQSRKRRRPAIVTCRYCGTRNLRWSNVKGGNWRLKTPDGKLHECQSTVARFYGALKMRRIELDNGKYIIEFNDQGYMKFFRHGEPWPGGQAAFEHAGMILAMVYRIEELERLSGDQIDEIAELRGELAEAYPDVGM